MMIRRTKRKILILAALVAALVFAILFHRLPETSYIHGLFGWEPSDPSLILTTGYCNCGKCCGWVRTKDGHGEPVYDYGPLKGRPKKVGITSTGVRAKHGTIAADPKFYPMGTRLEIPGYGRGTVEDVGGAIKGRRHLDLWFPSHDQARQWGRRWLRIKRLTP